MDSAKELGFSDGLILDAGEQPLAGHTYIPGLNGAKAISIPTSTIEEEKTKYLEQGGMNHPDFNRAYVQAVGTLKTVGLSTTPSDKDIYVGTDFRGNPVYSSKTLANSQSIKHGKQVATVTGGSIGAMGGFADFKEANRFFEIGNKAANPDFLQKLDTLKTNKDVKTFVQTIGGDFTGYKLFENWNNLSPTQKSLAVTSAGIQSYRFDDGKSLLEKKVTPEIPGVPSIHVAEGISLGMQGINVAPATRKWKQFAPLQQSMYQPKTGSETVSTAQSLGLLGFGMEGQAVNITENDMAKVGMQPSPQYGVGAVVVPINQGVPQGYVKLKNVQGKTVAIPRDNVATAAVDAPDVSSKAAIDVYRTWKKDANTKQSQGVVGGSALVGGLSRMTDNNPYSLGSQTAYFTLQNTDTNKNHTPMEVISRMSSVTLQRLLKGSVDKAVDSGATPLPFKGAIDEATFNTFAKNARAEYAKNGIASKEIGYQLANQGFAEKRFNESELVAIHKNLDMAFNDNGYVLAQKFSTGFPRGIEIMENHRG